MALLLDRCAIAVATVALDLVADQVEQRRPQRGRGDHQPAVLGLA
jgi:hypothetical protein